MKYDKLLVASGGKPKKLDLSGHNLKNIFTLRTANDAEQILSRAKKEKKIVIIGASFIGMEIAENINDEEREIHIIAPESVPFGAMLGDAVGELVRNKKREDGIQFHLGNTVSEFRGNSTLNHVVLDNGEKIQAGMAIVGIGINPVTEFMPYYDKVVDGSLLTDIYLQVEDDVFAAGDVATFPYWKTGDLIRIEHWRVAEQLGNIAAQNMLGMKKKAEIIPFFWSSLAGLQLRYVGYAGKWDDTIIHGDLTKGEFIVYYVRNKQVQAVLGSKRDEQIAIIEELFKLDKVITTDALKQEILSLSDFNQLLQSSTKQTKFHQSYSW